MWFILPQMTLPEDPNWPRASAWLNSNSATPDIEVVGVLAHQTSISPTNAHLTPNSVRQALARYSTYNLSLDVDVQNLKVKDLGNIEEVDFEIGEKNVFDFISENHNLDSLLIALGGDNSITYSVMQAKNKNDLSRAGLITFDAHFDLRDGISNGSPVQRLITAGLNPKRIVQIGIADFANSATYAKRAKDYGITVIPRSEIHKSTIPNIIKEAIAVAGSNVYVDIDVDVCDRAVAPACPASVPGGITANQLRLIAREIGKHKEITAIDFTEVDSSNDTSDMRTTRLVALCLLEIAAGRLSQSNL